ncbi:YjbA family protein [Aquibacillus sp. 3ASR75-11]|uniref:YjbA family protein n=1 Tax=Terrihalobacillus insolitus TaxID=2950438 RepID=A0A9X3WV80_9BACI|nr:YjbA family protein [Terrihalobacillus insolitus]MDC3413692.1 YjbA family protein [Terrihalobacillus insolitus]MDC3426290.1 YjbA family protein [Terrihalobacillus insolitus]
MLYLHDVWVNWFEGEENSYNVCPFHEWRKEDGIELLDQVPLLYISDVLYEYIENDLQDLPKSLLESIYQRGFLRKNQERITLDYACVITNGISVLAIDTMGYSLPIRKSRLIPRQERLVFEMIEGTEPQEFVFPTNQESKEYHILSLPPDSMLGLTRKERQLKQLLMMALDQLEGTKNLEEMRYWLTEWDPDNYAMIRKMDFYEAWQSLYQGVSDGWSQAHEELCGKIIKGQPFFEKMWEIEQQPVQQNVYKRML